PTRALQRAAPGPGPARPRRRPSTLGRSSRRTSDGPRLRPRTSEGSELSLGGAERDRTVDLLNAIQALSQLSYGPTGRGRVEAERGPVKRHPGPTRAEQWD